MHYSNTTYPQCTAVFISGEEASTDLLGSDSMDVANTCDFRTFILYVAHSPIESSILTSVVSLSSQCYYDRLLRIFRQIRGSLSSQSRVRFLDVKRTSIILFQWRVEILQTDIKNPILYITSSHIQHEATAFRFVSSTHISKHFRDDVFDVLLSAIVDMIHKEV